MSQKSSEVESTMGKVKEPESKEPVAKSQNTIKFIRARTLAVAVLLVTSMGFGFLGGWLSNRDASLTNGSSSHNKEVVLSESQLVNNIAKTVGPSVVSVNVTGVAQSSSDSTDFFGFPQPQQQEEQSEGTGIILSSDGLIITNRHVVPVGTTKVSVTLADGTELTDVKVLGRTNSSDSLDIAFLKVGNTKGKKLTPAALGDSSKVQIGDRVVAIGNALGQFQNTVTSGIISGHGRSVQASDQSGDGSTSENLQDLFQTDAAINEGNSGGPLVNASGQVIGINTAIAGNAQGIGFAIPINDVSGLIKNVLSSGKFEQPYLGVLYVPLTNDVASQYNLKTTRGAYILPSSKNNNGQQSVISGSPADKAGLKAGDIIVALNGTNIDESHSLNSLLDQHSVGDTVNLKILRGQQNLNLSVKLGTAPQI